MKDLDLIHKKLDKLDEKLDKLDQRMDDITVIQAKQEVSLAHHIKRTDQNEELIKEIKKLEEGDQAFKNKLLGAGKLVALLGVLAGIAKFLLELVK